MYDATADKPIAIDLFAGAGGLSLGFAAAGFHIAAAVELDSIHSETHHKNFPDTLPINVNAQDVTGRHILEVANLTPGSVSVVFGGPPCQGFSIMGHRNTDDPRNRLIFEFARLVGELRPKYFVMENVKGLTHKKNSPLVDRFIERVESYGYDVVAPPKVLNASQFGIPQHRQRVFFLGHLRGAQAPEYPIVESPNASATVWDAIGDLAELEDHDYLQSEDIHRSPLTQSPSDYVKRIHDELPPLREPAESDPWISGCGRSNHSEAAAERFARTHPGSYEPISRYLRLDRQGFSPTLRAGTGSDRGSHTAARPIHPDFPRCITVREAARLHSYPDWFQFHPTKWHGFRQIGNSVPPMLAKKTAQEIFSAHSHNVQQLPD